MESLYDANAPKKNTNLSLNSDLLVKARALKVNLSVTLEKALTHILAESRAKMWKQENRAAIKAYNTFVNKHGCFGDEYRQF